MENDGNSDYHIQGEIVEVVCDDDFVFYDKSAVYVYECLEGGSWNNSVVAICMKGGKNFVYYK